MKILLERQPINILKMVENLLKTLAVTLHFDIDCRNFCAYSYDVVFSEAHLSQILQEFCYRWVSERHTQLEGSMPGNVVVGLLVTVSRIFELIPESDWKQRFTFLPRRPGLPSQVSPK